MKRGLLAGGACALAAAALLPAPPLVAPVLFLSLAGALVAAWRRKVALALVLFALAAALLAFVRPGAWPREVASLVLVGAAMGLGAREMRLLPRREGAAAAMAAGALLLAFVAALLAWPATSWMLRPPFAPTVATLVPAGGALILLGALAGGRNGDKEEAA